jgi:SAM-dependent methyltransferase
MRDRDAPPDRYRELIKEGILDETAFVEAVFGGRRRGHTVPWNRVVIRPVLIRDKRRVQFSYFEGTKDITKNYIGDEVVEKVDELLALPFKSISLQTIEHDIQVQITNKGKAIIHQHRAPEGRELPSLRHDRQKTLILPPDRPDPFLQKIGIMTQRGQVRADMQKKLRQINEFLERLAETGELEKLERFPLTIVDCGCGSAHLTFAVYHYLNHLLNLPAHLIGIDVNQALLRTRAEQADALGWENLTFQAINIIDFYPPTPPDIVLALHACDTATDEALAQGIKWQSRLILSAPCCHHHLQQQLVQRSPPPQLTPLLRYGVFKERVGDVLTDTFRALLLRIMGYRTDIVEFVSTEHTGKNLMIRAVKSSEPGNHQAIQEYRDLKAFWQVTPYLEGLLEAELQSLAGW